MAMKFDEALRAIETAAGWQPAHVDAQGVAGYELERGGLNAVSPDGRRLVLYCDVGAYPLAPEQELERERLGALAAAAMREEGSTLSLREGRLELYRTLDMTHLEARDIVSVAEALLNDADRWRRRLGDDAASGASPSSSDGFSMGDWFQGLMAV